MDILEEYRPVPRVGKRGGIQSPAVYFKQAGEEKTPLLHLDIVDGMVGMNISLNRLGLRPDSHAASVALDLDI